MSRTLCLLAAAAVLVVANGALADLIHLECEDYKVGGEGVGYHDSDANKEPRGIDASHEPLIDAGGRYDAQKMN